MKKMKRFFALFLAMAMVLGMSMTTFAAGKAKITVNKAGEGATFKKLLVIEADPTTVTGWNFTSQTAADAYTSAFGSAGQDEDDIGGTAVSPQEAIAMLLLAQNPNVKLSPSLSYLTKENAATAGQIAKALSNVKALLADEFDDMQNGMEVDKAGIYAVLAEEEGYTYGNMAVYVGFGPVAGGNYPTLTNGSVDAKRSPNTITKENMGDAADNAVAVGDTVEFKVTSNFPYINANDTDKFYAIQDILTGAEFDMTSFVVTIGNKTLVENEDYTVTGMAQNEGTAPEIIINFNPALFEANALAGQEVVVTYSATVTEVDAHNTVSHSGTGIEGAEPAETDLYTGSITITKYAEDNATTLQGAEFVVARAVVVNEGTDPDDPDFNPEFGYEYATFDDEGKLTGWVNEIDTIDAEGNSTPLATRVITGEDGKATVNGLDEGVYAFIEVVAPEGYSLNEEPAVAELDFDGDEATAIFTTTTSMTDTTLNALPSTGGIGTTIFTVGGCAIMIVAAGLFFVSRRRASR